jgi:hypothetical protein
VIGAVRQEWALVGGVPRHVDEFAHLSPKDRPAATCLECKDPVIFKCGSVRSHYVAHRTANEECGAARGEGAEHYNAKLSLASALGQTDRFEAFRKCARCGMVKGTGRLEYRYDQVELEYTHPNKLRADVALLSGGDLVCVIEVFVSHRCGYEKVVFHDGVGNLLKRLSVLDSGKVIKILHETALPFDRQKSEEFRKAYTDYIGELEASYGRVRGGPVADLPKGLKAAKFKKSLSLRS